MPTTTRTIPNSVDHSTLASQNLPSHSGVLSSARWRGPRGSAPLLTLLESFVTDLTSLLRRSLIENPLQRPTALIPLTACVTLFGTTDGDPSQDIYVNTLSLLGPQYMQLHTIRAAALEIQLRTLSTTA